MQKNETTPCAECQTTIPLRNTWRVERFDDVTFHYCSVDCMQDDERSFGRIVPPVQEEVEP